MVGGSGHCRECMKDDVQCHVNTTAILRWRERVKEGKVTACAPTGTSCERCNTSLKRTCELPGTADLREKVNQKKAELAAQKKKADAEKKEGGETKAPGRLKRKAADDRGSAGPSRKRLYVEVELQKKVRTAEEDEKEELTEGEY